MAIHAISGAPGGGKTSLAMEELARQIALNEAAAKAGKPALVVERADGSKLELAQRPLYVANVDGLVDGGDKYSALPDPSTWNHVAEGDYCDCLNGTHQVLLQEGLRPDGTERESERFREELGKRRLHGHVIPDGSWILVDEAWTHFGHTNDARGKAPPLHVQALAEHRHRAIDFCWTFQGPSQIYPFVRPLIAPHWHTVARFGQFIDVYKWGEFVEDVKSQGMRDRAQKEPRALPTKQRSMYRSASAHTGRPKFPKKMIYGIAAMLAAVPLIYYAVSSFTPDAMAERGTGKAPEARLRADGASADGPGKGKPADEPMTAKEWAERLVPRIAGLHGSQPIFDVRQVTTSPRTLCMISGEFPNERCRCFTEQATPILDVLDSACRTWARDGLYDPFREDPESQGPRGFQPQGPQTGQELVSEADLQLAAAGRSAAPASPPPPPAPGVLVLP